jgi:hypothetical protein
VISNVKVIYGILDQTIAEDTKTYQYSGKTSFSDGSNAMNAQSAKNRLTYLEKNWIKLDGTRIFPDTSIGYDVGYESDNLSDDSGNISCYIEFDFANLHDSYGIKMAFGSVINSLSIAYYNSDTLVGTKDATGLTGIDYSNYDVRLQWNKVKITISKISAPSQRARLDSIIFGISDSFGPDDLISVKMGKSVSIKNDNTDSSEADITFFNSGRFDIQTIRDLPVGLQAGLKVTIYSDGKLFNNYIVKSTSVEEKGKIINLECYDKLYYLNDSDFKTGHVYSDGEDFYNIFHEIAEAAGVDISVDDSFKNIVSHGYIGTVSFREALRMAAEASNAVIKVDSGTISVVPFATTAGSDMGEDDIVDDTLDIENEDKILGVKVTQYQFHEHTSDEGLAQITDVALTGETQTLSIDYSTSPAIATSVTSSDNLVISDTVYGVDKAVVTFKGTAGETGWITIIGRGYSTSSAIVSGGYIDSHANEIDNTLITETSVANSVRDFQLAHSASNYSYTFEAFGNKNADVLNKIKVLNYNIIVGSVTYEIDEDTNSMTVTGEDA